MNVNPHMYHEIGSPKTCGWIILSNIRKNPLFLESWIKSGILYVKGMFTIDGIKDINDITENLKSKRNFLCEYLVIKNAIRKFNVDYSNVNNTKIKKPKILKNKNQ